MALDGHEADLVARLQSLGVGVYSSLNLTSLVRLDIRADEDGELYILVSDRRWLDLTAKWGNLVKPSSQLAASKLLATVSGRTEGMCSMQNTNCAAGLTYWWDPDLLLH
jgi:hypothetical protein